MSDDLKTGLGGPAGKDLANAIIGVASQMDNYACNSPNISLNSDVGMDTTLTLERVNIQKLEIDAKEIILDLDIGRAENILERLSTDGLRRLLIIVMK